MHNNFKNIPYFTLSDIDLFTKNRKTSSVYSSRWLKNKYIIKLREGYYVHSDYVKKLKINSLFDFYIQFISTNIVYSPSYLSMEYILFKNNVLTENVYNLTLVSTKKTANFVNSFGNFSYKSIKKDYFGDYKVIKVGNFLIYEAILEKALFDYFYFKRGIIWEKEYFLELRLNLDNINLVKFKKLVKKYNNKKLLKVIKFLELLK